MQSKKDKELEMFHDWKKTGSKKAFQDLYASFKPLIYSAAKKASYGSNIPEPAHRAYAAQAFYDALRTFSPTSGAALATHLYGSVQQKVKRLNYMYQNLGSMPEPRAQRVGVYQTEFANLHAELGRDPTDQELSQRLHMSVSDIRNLKSEITKDLQISEGVEETAFFEGSRESEILDHLSFDLTPEEKNIFEYIQGKNGKARMVKANGKIDFDRIARVAGISSSRCRTIYGSIKKKFEKAAR